MEVIKLSCGNLLHKQQKWPINENKNRPIRIPIHIIFQFPVIADKVEFHRAHAIANIIVHTHVYTSFHAVASIIGQRTE